MKARSLILRALLFAMILAPSALRTSAKPLGAPSCRVPKPELRVSTAEAKVGNTSDKFVVSMPGHHRQAPRLHRIHGKKISIQGGFTSAPRFQARTSFLFSPTSLVQQDMDGPNPSRGPPSQVSL
jgi:hypothetical protein